jgi:tight adherence protein B
MIVISIAAIFAALFTLICLAIPGQRVSKRRLGIERAPFSPGQSVDAFLERRGWHRGIAQTLATAGIDTEPGLFVLRVAVVSVLLALVGLFIGPLLSLVALVVPAFVVRTWVATKAGKRKEAFAEQLPTFLRSLVMSLRSGFGLPQSMESAAAEAQEPLRGEIERVLAEVRMGRSLPEAMSSLSQRMDSADLEWVVGAIEINRDTGGNLSDVLATVNSTLRERGRIQRKIITFTAEGRLSAKLLTGIPFLFGVWQWRAHPDGFAKMFQGAGLIMLGVCAGLLVLGWFWIRRVITIKL